IERLWRTIMPARGTGGSDVDALLNQLNEPALKICSRNNEATSGRLILFVPFLAPGQSTLGERLPLRVGSEVMFTDPIFAHDEGVSDRHNSPVPLAGSRILGRYDNKQGAKVPPIGASLLREAFLLIDSDASLPNLAALDQCIGFAGPVAGASCPLLHPFLG